MLAYLPAPGFNRRAFEIKELPLTAGGNPTCGDGAQNVPDPQMPMPGTSVTMPDFSKPTVFLKHQGFEN